MSDFRQLSDSVWASPQIDLADLSEVEARGFAMIINNRPEGESPDQTPGPVIEEAARHRGIAYCAIPISHAGFTEQQVSQMVAALDEAEGPVLAYCRSGTRSTFLWALAQARQGVDPAHVAAAAARAGYDVSPIGPTLEHLVARARS